MARYVALLRGVNVGGNRKLPMADLRDLFVARGYDDVETYIQSGNVVFSSARKPPPTALETAIADQFGLSVTVVLRTAAQMKQVVEANPFPDADPKTLHVGFMASKPAKSTVASLDGEAFEPDAFAIAGDTLYLHLPNGLGRAKLPAYLDRKIKIPTTVRNWNTVNKLIAMASG